MPLFSTDHPAVTVAEVASFLDTEDVEKLLTALNKLPEEIKQQQLDAVHAGGLATFFLKKSLPRDHYQQKQHLINWLQNPATIPPIENSLKRYTDNSTIPYENRLLAAAVCMHRYITLKVEGKFTNDALLIAAKKRLESLGKWHPKLFYTLALNVSRHDRNDQAIDFYHQKLRDELNQTLEAVVSHEEEWVTASQLLYPGFFAGLDIANLPSHFLMRSLVKKTIPLKMSEIASHMDLLIAALSQNDPAIRLSVCHGIRVFAPLLDPTLVGNYFNILLQAEPVVDGDRSLYARTRKAVPHALAALALRLTKNDRINYLNTATQFLLDDSDYLDRWKKRMDACEFLLVFLSQPEIELGVVKKYLAEIIEGLKTVDSRIRRKLCKLFATVAAQLDAPTAQIYFDRILKHVHETIQPTALEAEGQALTALVFKLDAVDIDRNLEKYADLFNQADTKPDDETDNATQQLIYCLTPVIALLQLRKEILKQNPNEPRLKEICIYWLEVLFNQIKLVARNGSNFSHTCRAIGELASQITLERAMAEHYAGRFYRWSGIHSAVHLRPFRYATFIALPHLVKDISVARLQRYFFLENLHVPNSISNAFNRLLLPDKGYGSLHGRDNLRQAMLTIWQEFENVQPAPKDVAVPTQPTTVAVVPRANNPITGLFSFFCCFMSNGRSTSRVNPRDDLLSLPLLKRQ